MSANNKERLFHFILLAYFSSLQAAKKTYDIIKKCAAAKQFAKPGAIKDVVTEDQADRIAADKLLTNKKRLCQALRFRLLGV